MLKLTMRLFVLSLSFLSIHFAQAAKEDSTHALTVGAGQSHPSGSLPIVTAENSAGLIFNSKSKIDLHASSLNQNNLTNPLMVGGGFIYGNGTVGMGVGFDTVLSNPSANINTIRAGLSAEAKSLKVAFGLSGSYLLTPGTADLSAGLLVNPDGMLRVGFGAYSLVGGINDFGGGVAFDLSHAATLAIDADVNQSFKGLTVKPALGVYVSKIQLTLGYGFQLDNTAAVSIIRTGLAAGLGFELSQNLALQATYHYVGDLFANLSIRM